MKLINLEQGTKEWHKYRSTRIGASDFALFACHKGLSEPIFNASLNENIYNKQNNIELADNIYMQRGREKEPILLAEFNNLTGLCCLPAIGQYEHKDGYEYVVNIFSSFDGYDPFSNTIVEIKTTSKTIEDEEKILQYYSWQLIHQMHCAEIDECYLYIEYFGSNIKRLYKVKNKSKFNITHTVTVGSKNIEVVAYERFFVQDSHEDKLFFWRNLCFEYLKILNSNGIETILPLLNSYNQLSEEIKQLTEEKDNIREQIESLCPNGGVYDNYIITKISKGSISYKQFVEDNKLIIGDNYKKESISYRITKKTKGE